VPPAAGEGDRRGGGATAKPAIKAPASPAAALFGRLRALLRA
jgi:hypothetical protein